MTIIRPVIPNTFQMRVEEKGGTRAENETISKVNTSRKLAVETDRHCFSYCFTTRVGIHDNNACAKGKCLFNRYSSEYILRIFNVTNIFLSQRYFRFCQNIHVRFTFAINNATKGLRAEFLRIFSFLFFSFFRAGNLVVCRTTLDGAGVAENGATAARGHSERRCI